MKKTSKSQSGHILCF